MRLASAGRSVTSPRSWNNCWVEQAAKNPVMVFVFFCFFFLGGGYFCLFKSGVVCVCVGRRGSLYGILVEILVIQNIFHGYCSLDSQWLTELYDLFWLLVFPEKDEEPKKVATA